MHTEPQERQGPGHQHHGRPRDLQRLPAQGHARTSTASCARRACSSSCSTATCASASRRPSTCWTRSRTWASPTPPAPASPSASTTSIIPEGKEKMVGRRPEGGDRGREAVPRRRHHQRRALQQGHLDLVRRSPRRSPTPCSRRWRGRTRKASSSTRSTSWPTRAPAARSSRSASSPACAASWPSPRARSSRTRSPPTSARVSPSCSTSSPPTARARASPTPRSRPPTPAT